MYSSADLLARTIMAEAGNQDRMGKIGVGASILNRMAPQYRGRYGETMQDVLMKPYQYEPWNTRREEMLNYDTSSPEYREAAEIAVGLMSGDIKDPTGGATHFLNPEIVRKRRGGSLPSWYDESRALMIGDHGFIAADNRDWRPPTMAMKETPQQEPERATGGGYGGSVGGGGMGANNDAPAAPETDAAQFDLEGLLGGKEWQSAMNLLKQAEGEKPAAPPPAQIVRPKARKRGSLRGLLA